MLIRKAAVIGSGTMGSGIAAHLANAGVPCVLLDIVPPDLQGPEGALASGRSRLAREAVQRQLHAKPGGFFERANALLVEPGNVEDDLEKLRECDWIIEAVPEKLEIKRDLYRSIAPFRRENAIVSSNTSGISLRLLTEGLDESFRRHFLVTHFFNPPRYLYLLELVPGPETLPQVHEAVARFADIHLGKGIVRCKDTPTFIGNRIGVYAMASCAHLTETRGLSYEQVDAITGRPMGRPRTATYRLQDLVGIDVAVSVMENVRDLLPADESRDLFVPPPVFRRLVDAGRCGRKTGAGFYKKEGKEILVLDPGSFEYRPQEPVSYSSLDALRGIGDAGERLRTLLAGDDAAARFAWEHIAGVLCYSARRIPEISDDIVAIDRALRWGFAWELGPFEIWDAIGVRESVERMEREGIDPPENVRAMLERGESTFYMVEGSRRTYFDFDSGSRFPVPERPGVLRICDLQTATRPIRSNDSASIWDVGEGVLCVEFHSKMNTITGETLCTIVETIELAEAEDRPGVVIGNDATNFSAGANLAMLGQAAREQKWTEIEEMIRTFHRTVLRMRYALCPVVVATRGLCLGGGLELPLAGHRIQAAAESYMGLVELGVGLIPAGGGTRELACRSHEAVPEAVGAGIFPYVRRAFEAVAMARTASSAAEARSLGFLRETDGISANRDRVLADAKRVVLHLAERGFRPPPPRHAVRVVGRPGLAELRVLIHQFREGRHISDYDAHLADSLATVLCGGEVDDTVRVTEQYLLDLECDVFLRLCGQTRSLDRIDHMLKTGKPLRN